VFQCKGIGPTSAARYERFQYRTLYLTQCKGLGPSLHIAARDFFSTEHCTSISEWESDPHADMADGFARCSDKIQKLPREKRLQEDQDDTVVVEDDEPSEEEFDLFGHNFGIQKASSGVVAPIIASNIMPTFVEEDEELEPFGHGVSIDVSNIAASSSNSIPGVVMHPGFDKHILKQEEKRNFSLSAEECTSISARDSDPQHISLL
jgi:hypothetical protein